MNSAKHVCIQTPAASVSNTSSQTQATLTSNSPIDCLTASLTCPKSDEKESYMSAKMWREKCHQLKKKLKVGKSAGSSNLRNILSATEKLLS
jgi:hypothetical protein